MAMQASDADEGNGAGTASLRQRERVFFYSCLVPSGDGTVSGRENK